MTTERLESGARGTTLLEHGNELRATVRRSLVAVAVAALGLGSLAPVALAADPLTVPLTVTTPYPAVLVAPGAHVSFNVTVTTSSSQRVALVLSGAPDAWNASLHGGGFVVDELLTSGTDPATVRVDLDVPGDASGTTKMILKATAGADVVELPLQVRVDAAAAGDLTLTTDVPSLEGPSSQTFNFNLTLRNDTAEDVTFSVNATGPAGWTVQANLTGQAQAASAIVKAGSTSGVTVSAEPPDGAAAGTYDIGVVAVVREQNITGSLQVNITGSYNLVMDTADGRLNGRGVAGSASPLSFTVSNTGTAAVTNVKLTSSAPSGWKVTFDQETIPSIEAGASVTVSAQITPSGSAIAGDYNVTLNASGDQSTRDSIEIRYQVETSILWGIIGLGLIVVVVAGVWWVFQRYGRR